MNATLSFTHLSDPVETWEQMGGRGRIWNKGLAFSGHLGGAWSSLEDVRLDRSTDRVLTSVGRHRQRTDEVYVIRQGRGRLTTNGIPEEVKTRDVVIAPKGTVHTIENLSTNDELAFLVVELATPTEELRLPTVLRNELEPTPLSPGDHWQDASASLGVGQVDLGRFFTAPWGNLRLIHMPPNAHVKPYVLKSDELLYVFNVDEGRATIKVGDDRTFTSTRDEDAGMFLPSRPMGLAGVVPAGMTRSIRNNSSIDPLVVLSLEVLREVASPAQQLLALEEAQV